MNEIIQPKKEAWSGNEMLWRIVMAVVLGLVGVIIFGCYYTISTVCTGLLLGGACFTSGAFLGFLFGIPRTKNSEDAASNEGGKPGGNGYKPNTNLEQISDWLTKIIVGVGLVELGRIIRKFGDATTFFSKFLGGNEAITASIIIYFLVFGFLLGFLWSRLYMAGAILDAERRAAELSEMERRVVKRVQTKAEEQAEADARAIAVVNQQLDINLEAQDEAVIKEAITKASPAIKVTVFNQAKNYRQQYWNVKEDRNKIGRVIPIFKALIECDPENKFHRNYGQLGYALKDQEQPDYSGAEKAFTKAIAIRDAAGHNYKWLLYEMNRAICRIKVNELNNNTGFSLADIKSDIEKAKKSDSVKAIVENDPVISNWVGVHQ